MDSCIPGRRAHARRPRRTLELVALLLATSLVRPSLTHACDICAIYTATEQRESRTGPRLGLATQYSHYATVEDDGEEVANPAGQYMDSVVTQLVFGYQVTPRIGLQVALPIISRQYLRIQDDHRVRGNAAGPGDLSLLANALAYSRVTETSVFTFSLLGGLKLPTGNSSLLAEELDEDHHHHGAPENVVHGHDLALGSGSVDGIVGGDLFLSWQRAFFSAALQYAIRTEGSFDYRYANDLTWFGGPGVYALLGHDYSVALQALVSGETKGKDQQAGRPADDTAVTNMFVGPRVQFTWGTQLFVEGSVGVPVIQHNTALQIVADYRLRAAAVWRF